MSEWKLIYESFEPGQEGLREALCTLGNGYFATRGAAEEAEADDVHYPGTYLAGGYNRLQTDIAGRVIENEDLVNLPNWLCLTFRPEGGDWFNLRRVEILAYRQELDLKQGLLARHVRFRDRDGRETTLVSRRLVHMAAPHLAAIEMTLRPENWSGRVEIRSAIDGRVINAGVERYRQLSSTHLEPREAELMQLEGVPANQGRGARPAAVHATACGGKGHSTLPHQEGDDAGAGRGGRGGWRARDERRQLVPWAQEAEWIGVPAPHHGGGPG